ncbi:MAG: extracellular solute-binding protein [Firmicutes bacterium]|nr:extracellular solute-binding protein [Bacillota bacterium]
MKDRGVFVIFVVLILLVAALIIKSILPSSFFAETNSHEDKTVLRLSGYGGYLEEEYMKEVKDEFEQLYPHIQIILEIAPTSTEDMGYKAGFIPGYEQRILADYAAKDAPDVFYVPQGRTLLYIEAGGLINLQPFLSEKYEDAPNTGNDIYMINRGTVNLGVSSQTEHSDEAFLLVDFIKNHYKKRLEITREKAIEKGSAFLLPGSGLENREAFEEAWNAFAVAMSRNDLLLWNPPDIVSLYWGFKVPNDPYDYLYVQLGSDPFTKQIGSAIVSFRALHGDNKKLVENFRTAIEISIRAVDPTLTTKEAEKIIADLGFDMGDFDLLPFHMVGAVYYNGYEYSTEATQIDIELTRKKEFYKIDSLLVYQLRAKKQGMLLMPYRKYPKLQLKK